MTKPEETKEEKPVSVWAKISVLVGLVIILILGLILPVKIVPQTLSMFSSAISSIFIPKELALPETSDNSQASDYSENVVAENTTTPEAPVANEPAAPIKPETAKITTPYGLADLEVRIIGVGYLTKTTDIFIPSTAIYPDHRAAVKFQIINVGTNNTGMWGFSASLPSLTDSQYNSPLQQNLRPGDRIEYVMGFNNPTPTPRHIGTITANPSNTVYEYSKTNNSATVFFPIINANQ